MAEEYEIIRHPHLNYFNMFLVDIDYRTPHLHRDFEIDLIMEGHATFVVNGTAYTMAPGSIILLNPDQLHEIKTQSGPSTILSLQVSPRFFVNAVPNIESIFFAALFPLSALTLSQQAAVYHDLLHLASIYIEKESYFELECMSILTSLMHLLLCALPLHSITPEMRRDAKKRAERIRRVIDYVDENYTRKTRLQDIAQQEGLSLNYLSLFVKENLNMTFQEYVGSLRLNHAKKLLVSDNRSLLSVSIESGFSDPRYLTKAFLANVEMTPDEYRKQRLPPVEEGRIHRSPHSSERYYSEEQAKRLIQDVERQGFEPMALA